MASKKKTTKQAPKTTKKAAVQTPPEQPTPDASKSAEVVQPANESQRAARAAGATKGGKQEQRGLSAINAAARVLARKGQPMNCKELIGVMAMDGLWTSPGGKTPHATLHAAILREIKAEGEASRFVKVGRGMFAINPKITTGDTPQAGKAKKGKAKGTKGEATDTPIPDGTEGPESLKELFRI